MSLEVPASGPLDHAFINDFVNNRRQIHKEGLGGKEQFFKLKRCVDTIRCLQKGNQKGEHTDSGGYKKPPQLIR